VFDAIDLPAAQGWESIMVWVTVSKEFNSPVEDPA